MCEYFGREVPEDFKQCPGCAIAHECQDVFEHAPYWGDEIPFDGSPLPACNHAPARPLVYAEQWRQEFSAMYDADDGYNPATVAPAWQPERRTVEIVNEIMGR